MKKILFGALAAAVLYAGALVAQTVTLPQVSVVNPNDLIQIIPLGKPHVGNQYATPAQITSQSNYAKASPLASFSYTFANSQIYLDFNGAGTTAAGTVTLAPAPSDGARECIWTSGTITSLTVAANTGQTINNAVTSLSANSGACYLYSASNATWDRD